MSSSGRPAQEPPHRAPLSRVLLRALRLRCPACGLEPVFRSGLRPDTACRSCEWPFERCPGHWIGGSEINMVISFWVGSGVSLALVWAFGMSWTTMLGAAVFTAAFSAAIHRSCRAVFIALDFVADPRLDSAGGGDDDWYGGIRPTGPAPRGAKSATPPPARPSSATPSRSARLRP